VHAAVDYFKICVEQIEGCSAKMNTEKTQVIWLDIWQQLAKVIVDKIQLSFESAECYS